MDWSRRKEGKKDLRSKRVACGVCRRVCSQRLREEGAREPCVLLNSEELA